MLSLHVTTGHDHDPGNHRQALVFAPASAGVLATAIVIATLDLLLVGLMPAVRAAVAHPLWTFSVFGLLAMLALLEAIRHHRPPARHPRSLRCHRNGRVLLSNSLHTDWVFDAGADSGVGVAACRSMAALHVPGWTARINGQPASEAACRYPYDNTILVSHPAPLTAVSGA